MNLHHQAAAEPGGKDGLALALAGFGGSPSALARAIGGGVKRQNVESWVRTGRVPEAQCPAVERLSGVPCERLRVDVRWVRVPDAAWPHPGGRPLIDVAGDVQSAAQPGEACNAG